VTLPLGAIAKPGLEKPAVSTAAKAENLAPLEATAQRPAIPSLLDSQPKPTSNRPALLIDVTPLSLCVETVGGYVDVLVNRNTPIPCERTRDFVTAQDNQQTVVVRVAQGESKTFQENVLLGEVQLTGIPPAPRGQSRIAVTFGIDSDGILHVRALDVHSGQSALADLRLSGAPTSPEVQQMMARHASKAPKDATRRP
jgi:molecular chaperone DnaK